MSNRSFPYVWASGVAAISIVAGLFWLRHSDPSASPGVLLVEALNLSYPTRYEEEDNVHVALRAPENRRIRSFVIEARHPAYSIGEDYTEPGRFPEPAPPFTFDEPGIYTLYNDGTTLLQGVRQDAFWRPTAMTVRVGTATMPNIHFLQLHRLIPGTDSRPQILVLYTDGNLRLKPLPQIGRRDQVFGSSILIGPAEDSQRPAADIRVVEYQPDQDTLRLSYRSGGSATIAIAAANREVTRISVLMDFQSSTFARLRSMFVAEGNSDVDRVRWHGVDGARHEQWILSLSQVQARDFLFLRPSPSRHNTSAPDIWIGDFVAVEHD